MDKKPILFRTFLVLVVIAVFVIAMYPLTPRNFYETFRGILKDPKDPNAATLIADAQARQEKNADLFESQALTAAAADKGVDLTAMVKADGLRDNGDVISYIRKKASSSIRLGLDLNGGVEFYLELIPDKNQSAEMKAQMESDFKHYRDVAVENLRRRLEQKSIYEAEIAPSGERHIVLRAPLVSNSEKAVLRDTIRRSAKLEFRLVKPASDTELDAARKDRDSIDPDVEYMEYTEQEKGKPVVRRYLVKRRVEMDGKNIVKAQAVRDEMGQRKILLKFNSNGAQDFKRVTQSHVGEQLAIVLDGELYCAPVIRVAIADGSAEISGSFSDDEAKSIADALTAGSFPFTINVAAMFDTDPTLGKASVKNGIVVGIISLVIVALFMLLYYRGSGLIAVFALALNMVLILGAMAAFDCTLTLPGIAGIVLTIGMAVDANVLIFERIREELRSGKSTANAVSAGYDRALSAVLDSNITTLVTALILMNVGTGAIKGFAITLCIGILSSVFSAVFVTRLIYDYLFRFFHLQNVSMLQIFATPKFDFVKMWSKALLFSGALIVLLVVMFVVRGRGMLGIDFTGGSSITYEYAEQGNTSKMAATLRKAGYDQPSVTYKTQVDGRKLMEVRLRGGSKDDIARAEEIGKLLDREYPALKIRPETAKSQNLDGLIGREFTKTAIYAVVLALIGIGAYIMFRYEFAYAIASVLALLHDVLVVLAIYLAVGRTIGLTTVAAFLTVIGYSINDTVVIFDRLRENLNLHEGAPFEDMVNLSINQTFGRTMITSITTFAVVFVMWVGGSPEINDFVFVMMLGVILGTYSSVMLSAPFVAWRRRSKLAKAIGGK